MQFFIEQVIPLSIAISILGFFVWFGYCMATGKEII